MSEKGVSRRNVIKGVQTIGAGSAIVSVAGCVGGNGDGGDDGYEIGLSMPETGLSWFDAFMRGGEWYAEDQGAQMNITDGQDDPATQASNIQSMIASGVDAIIVMPVDSNAAVSPVEEATDAGIPVFTSNATVNTDDVVRYISWGNRDAGRAAGEAIIDLLEERHGEPRGEVMAGYDSLDFELGVARAEGFEEVIDEYDEVELVASWAGSGGENEAFQNFTDQIQGQGVPDAIYGANQPKMPGAMSALDQHDSLHTSDHEDHVIICGIDAGPQIIPGIKDGYLDVIVDQPTQFYNAILFELIIEYLESGEDESVLPDVGDTITEDDITLEGSENHLDGINPWAEPIWAPAEVIWYENDGEELHPYIQTASVPIGDDLIDEPFLWGNWVEDI